MRVLVTGAGGFIGSHLCCELENLGYQVVALARTWHHRHYKPKELIYGNILDTQLVNEIVYSCEIIIHLASITAHDEIVEHKIQTLQTNLRGTQNVAEAFLKSPHTKKLYYASTGKVYGKIESNPITEKHPTRPLNILGKTKRITELLLELLAVENMEKNIIIFRIFNIFGPHQKESFLIPTILSQLSLQQNSNSFKVNLGDVYAQRDYLHVNDLVSAFILHIENGNHSIGGLSYFNVASGIPHSAESIIRILERILDRKIEIETDRSKLRLNEDPIEFGSAEALHKEVSWSPAISLQEGLASLLKGCA